MLSFSPFSSIFSFVIYSKYGNVAILGSVKMEKPFIRENTGREYLRLFD